MWKEEGELLKKMELNERKDERKKWKEKSRPIGKMQKRKKEVVKNLR